MQDLASNQKKNTLLKNLSNVKDKKKQMSDVSIMSEVILTKKQTGLLRSTDYHPQEVKMPPGSLRVG